MTAPAQMTARPELLAPAGEPRALRAALAAGADAVYFGLERWSARAFAGNFAGQAVVEALDLAHTYGARAYLALNTLLKDDEVGPALAALEAPYLAGLDALIVADLGFAARAREAYPELPLHASTQCNTHSSAQLAALGRLGFRRAILARELSLTEIAALDAHGLELEVFVHGALCYGYSGDCLLSSMVGGRSGNRGRCSQACRLRYSLRRGGSTYTAPVATDPRCSRRLPGPEPRNATESEATRVMSTSNLAAIGVLPRLLAAGVTSFKIEGRMKDAAYVGVTTAVYRDALDAALADPEDYTVLPEWSERLEHAFSRSFTIAHLEGEHDAVRSGGRGGHRGVLVGRVTRSDQARGEIEIRLSSPVSAGDLVYLYTSTGQTEPLRLEEGAETSLTLRLHERVGVKDRLFRLAATQTDELARDLEMARVARRPQLLRMRLAGRQGEPAALTVAVQSEPETAPVSVVSESPLALARTAPLEEPKAREALGALGGTPYRLGDLDFAVESGLFMAVSDLKDLRRRAVTTLGERCLEARRRGAVRASLPPLAAPSAPAAPQIARSGVVLILRPGEEPVSAPGLDALCLDALTADAPGVVGAAAAKLRRTGLAVRLRLPEVVFDGDAAWLRAVLAEPWDAVYVRQLGVLAAAAAVASDARGAGVAGLIMEAPLQGLNGLTAAVAAGLAGRPAAAVVVSPEMALAEIAGLRATIAEGPVLEALAFGRQQVLHTRDRLGMAEGLYEPLAAEEHVGLLLEDAKGYAFPADVDPTGTRLFNARVTNLAPNLDELREAGVAMLLVVQSDLNVDERRAFATGGLPALAAFASRERSTTGHLFRGVA